MKKSYATMAPNSSRAAKTHQSFQNTSNLQSQLAELASLLSGPTTPPQKQPPEQQLEDASRSKYVEQINHIDDALARLPDTPAMQGARAPLLAEKEKYKKLIINSKPLGVRLEGCRGALARARKRQATAITELEQAQVQLAEATSNVTAKEQELQELEAQFAATAVESAGPVNHGTCLDNLNQDMKRVLSEMEMGGVDVQHVQACVSQMSSLFNSLTALAKEQQAKAAPTQQSILTLLGATARAHVDAANLPVDLSGQDFPEDWYSDQEMHGESEAKNKGVGGAHGGS